ncbi:MAG: hypothetical protein H7Z37_08865 [Pyrinomonadaceae bacterium]|nr:hypothetical protein [Pyrinomonadaceae bacterium]
MDAIEPKPIVRCERCDRETDEYVVNLTPDNITSFICWTCQERDDKNYTMKPSFRRERSGGRYLPKSPKLD